jgi:catechol 2,3-dioxygenase-like lactoylglutathione lyase family enzyme
VQIERLDHLVLTVADIDRTVDFYTRVLGMRAETFGAGRRALRFGE